MFTFGRSAPWRPTPVPDRGAPHDAYFARLDRLLREEGHGRPSVVVDLDRVDHNCAALRESLSPALGLRIVAKSLPCARLLAHVMAELKVENLMVFHAPHLVDLSRAFPRADLLVGKPLPVAAARRCLHALSGDAHRKVQWLVDTPERLADYAGLARQLGLKLRVSLEIDVGLGRGGFEQPRQLGPVLSTIAEHGEHLELSGFMGYDAHVGGMPAWLESREVSLARAARRYRAFVGFARAAFPAMMAPGLVLNGAGSKTVRLYDSAGPLSELSAGSCLVRPADFEVPLLADLLPAAFIATPVLKVLEGYRVPGLPRVRRLSQLWSKLDPNRERTVFIYGGGWRAVCASPQGLEPHALFGFSANQAAYHGSARTGLRPDDHLFLLPGQSESLLLSFGDLTIVRNGKIVDLWPPLSP